MNHLIELHGDLTSNPASPGGSFPTLPKGASVSSAKLHKLIEDLDGLKNYWAEQDLIPGALVSALYTRIISKTDRIRGFFSTDTFPVDDNIVGAKFVFQGVKKHQITYYFSKERLNASIDTAKEVERVIDLKYHGNVTWKDIESLKEKGVRLIGYNVGKNPFAKYVRDTYYLEDFLIPSTDFSPKDMSIVTLYDTNQNVLDILRKIGLQIRPENRIGNTTVLLRKDEYQKLSSAAPYLVAMTVPDLSKIVDETIGERADERTTDIPDPEDEPTVGVIDSEFDERVYFSKWVNNHTLLPKDAPLSNKDYIHGTEIDSIIVDGPAINPSLEDNCGRFRVEHFGVISSKGVSSFYILKQIDDIVRSHTGIRVWNLSLGIDDEVNENFISPEASLLDQIQKECHVIFVISGTNDNDKTKRKRIGAPADSINGLVVNSVRFDGTPASYSRKGPVLSFFNKPDVAYYGGDGPKKENMIRVCDPNGEAYVAGTSFAAPWITRKMAFLIEIMGFSIEAAKALIIDSSLGWRMLPPYDEAAFTGYGIVPKKVENVINPKDDEIRFIVSGSTDFYKTWTHKIPVPQKEGKCPFIAKATMCYIPSTSRNQGVDYTSTELDLCFGKIKGNHIMTINENKQDDSESRTYEEQAREYFRKWDNVKHVNQRDSGERGLTVAYEGFWGFSLMSKARGNKNKDRGMLFSLVVTLKNVSGDNVNRYESFLRGCNAFWNPIEIKPEERINVYNKAQEDIVLK